VDLCVQKTFDEAYKQLADLPPRAIIEIADLRKWLLEGAETVFVYELLELLVKDRNRYLEWVYLAYESSVRSLLAYLCRKDRNHPEVDYCVQQTFESVIRALKNKSPDQIRALVRFRSWLNEAAVTAFKGRERFGFRPIRMAGRKEQGEQVAQEEQVAQGNQGEQAMQSEAVEQDESTKQREPVRGIVIDSLDQHRETVETIPDSGKSPEDELLEKEGREETARYLSSLPDRYGVTLRKHYLEGLKFAQIAEQEHVEETVVKTWAKRGRELLLAYLEVKGFTEDEGMREYIDTLATPYRGVVLLHFYEHLALDKIADRLHWTEKRAKESLARAVKPLYDYVRVSKALRESQAERDYVDELPDSYRMAVRLHFLERRTFQQIVTGRGWTIKKAMGYLHNGVERLRQHLDEQLEKQQSDKK
jgi:RNA polymerase sigma factor (sigma-70 family)